MNSQQQGTDAPTIGMDRNGRQNALLEHPPRLRNGLLEFPVHHMRGGTSTGVIIWERYAPDDLELREELARHLMGVPLNGTTTGNRQITGLGRGIPTSNKVFFADTETWGANGVRLVSTLAQMAADKAAVDWSVNCGNMSAALPLWAFDTGLVEASATKRIFEIDIRNTNTGIVSGSRFRFAVDEIPEPAEIPGVDGLWPELDLYLYDPVGNKTGTLLPTGRLTDTVFGTDVSCLDVAVPMVIIRASDLGKTACEPIEELEADAAFKQALRNIWVECGLRMGLKKKSGQPMSAEDLAASETVPKVCIVGPPQGQGNIATRYFTPQVGHTAMAVSGGCCLAAASVLPGTVAHSVAKNIAIVGNSYQEHEIKIENPAGILAALVDVRQDRGRLEIRKAAYKRNAQLLLCGYTSLYRASEQLKHAVLDKSHSSKAAASA